MAKLTIFGTVKEALVGRVTAKDLRPCTLFRFALGSSTLSDEKSLGETIIIEGTPHISPVEKGKVIHQTGRSIKTPFLMGIDREQAVGLVQQIAFPVPLGTLYGKLAQKYPKGFAIAASFQMELFCGTYLKKPPIFNENINELHDTYWAPVKEQKDIPICLFGVVIPRDGRKSYPKEVLEKAFYQNPQDKGENPFDSHTHAGLTDQIVKPDEMGQLPISGVRHTLTQSVVARGACHIFPFTAIESI